jgi:hypothetical protein
MKPRLGSDESARRSTRFIQAVPFSSGHVELDSEAKMTENAGTEIRGRVHNGVVVLEDEPSLPEGMMVTVLCPSSPPAGLPRSGQRVSLPLVPSDRPGSRRLTAERVADLLEDGELFA